MKSELEKLKERVEIYLKGKSGREDAVRFLQGTGIEFEDASEECGYPNFRFKAEGGYVRAYRARKMKEFKVQIFERIPMRYSGVPVFEPSGRKNF